MADETFSQPEPSLCVLSSSSRGNCSVLVLGQSPQQPARVWLIDCGLSPKRTRLLLSQVGLGEATIAGALLTHLDHDHWHAGWLEAMPDGATVHIHRAHRGRADRQGLTYLRTNVFDEDFELHATLAPGVVVRPIVQAHDDLGAAAFRIEFAGTSQLPASLGFATDLGSPTRELEQHLAGVDVLAIESNYCPRMQQASDRPAFLKERITGGCGHLSNQQSAALVRRIRPRSHVALLHLSQQCNSPDEALRAHAWRSESGAPSCTLAQWDTPTPWISIRASAHAAAGAIGCWDEPRQTMPQEMMHQQTMPKTLWECV